MSRSSDVENCCAEDLSCEARSSREVVRSVCRVVWVSRACVVWEVWSVGWCCAVMGGGEVVLLVVEEKRDSFSWEGLRAWAVVVEADLSVEEA